MKSLTEEPDKDVVLTVSGVSKKFCRDLKTSLLYGVEAITNELLGKDRRADLREKEFWALNNVSFKLRRGESLGLVGSNGAGKTTLLRIIGGLIKPDTGFVEITGRVAPLLALGAAINPILTGRENIYINMSILGLSQKMIDDRFDAVVDFAEIGDAIDSPVQSYSTGMQARLGFSCAIHTDPDILLIDEVLAVGDAYFRAKCFRKLDELKKKNVSFILVSHSSNAIFLNCRKSLYLKRGVLHSYGDSRSVLDTYERDLYSLPSASEDSKAFVAKRKPIGSASAVSEYSLVFVNTTNEKTPELLESGKNACLKIECKANRNINDILIHLVIRRVGNVEGLALTFNNIEDGVSINLNKGNNTIELHFSPLCLRIGTYSMQFIMREGALNTIDEIDSAVFTVSGEMINKGVNEFYQPRVWN